MTAVGAPTRVLVFCDGSCLKNPGPGGWAALLRTTAPSGEVRERLIAGGQADTTNNQMELRAAAEGLRALKRPCSVVVHTDSNYVVQGMTTWRFGWEKNGWRNAKKQPVENQTYWQALIAAAAPHEVTWQWVKGHAGHAENERVDVAARTEAEKIQAGM